MPKVIHKNFTERYIVGGLMLACLVATLFLIGFPTTSAARWVNATASITVESTCSMTATVNTAHTATLVNGIYSGSYTTNNTKPYEEGIGETTIQTFCNDQNGYAIYAIGFTNDTLGNTVLQGAGLSSTYDIATGTATSGTAGNDVSNWAMKVTAVASDANNTYTPSIQNGFSSFSAVPSSYTKVAKLDKATDAKAGTNLGSTIKTTYAAYISNTQPAGTYTGQVKYVLVHPNLSAAPDTLVMQEIADWKGTVLAGEQVTAVDNRDGSTYTVTLMDDGNVWMTQNLDLKIGGTYNNNPIVLTSQNTDLRQYDTNGDGTGTVFSGYSYDGSVITWTPTDATLTGTPATITFPTSGTSGTVSGWSNTNTGAKMAEGADTIMYQGTRYITDETSTALAKCEAANHTEAECVHGRVGNYYNWTAAVAMNNTSSYSTDYTVMPNSICPAGWRLPNGPTSSSTISDFNTLFKAFGITSGDDYGTGSSSINVGYNSGMFSKMETSPLYFARSGDVSGTTLSNFSTYGLYWSSTVRGGSSAYYLYYNSTVLYPAYRVSRSYGRSVRCIAR